MGNAAAILESQYKVLEGVADNPKRALKLPILFQIPHKLIVPGITLPFESLAEDFKTLVDNRYSSEAEVAFTLVFDKDHSLVGKKKTDLTAMDDLQALYLAEIKKERPTAWERLPKEYKFFGNGNYLEILKQLCKTNPFYTSAMRFNAQTDDKPEYTINTVIDISSGEKSTRFSRIMEVYEPSFPRVNIAWNAKTWELASLKVFVHGEDVTAKYTEEQAVQHLLFSLTFYAELLHATIHIFDLTMIIGMLHASYKSNVIYEWTETFLRNVPVKYNEVVAVLYGEDGDLTGGPSGYKVINRDIVLTFVREEILKPWFHYDTANDFVEDYILCGIPKDQRDGIAEEFRKHIALLPAFATDMTAAMKEQDCNGLESTNERLKEYMASIGDDIATVSNMHQWIELISAFGIFHGTTLSFTRVTGMAPMLALVDPSVDHFTKLDEDNVTVKLGTNLRLQDERAVFHSGFMEEKKNPLIPVLKKFEVESNAMKNEYWERISKDPQFLDYGWIWTDYCPDMIDNKQFTLTTYV